MTTLTADLPRLPRAAARRTRGRFRHLFASASLHPLFALPFAVLVTVFALQYSTYLVHWIFWDRVIKLSALFCLVALFPYRGIPRKFRTTLLLFGALFVTAALGSIATFDMGGIIQLVKLIISFLVLPLIVLRFRAGDAPAPILLKAFIVCGLLLSVQGLAMWSLVLRDHPPPATLIHLERLEHMPEWDLGIYGYGNTLGWVVAGYYYYRPQGWFTEPSGLASFLLYPTFVSFGIFLTTRKLRYLFFAIVCGAGLLTAFALAGYMAALAGILAVLIVRPRANLKSRQRTFWIIPIVLGLAFLYSAQLLMKQTYTIHQRGKYFGNTRVSTLLGRDPDKQRLVQKYYRVEESLALVAQNPLGIGLGNTQGSHETTSMNAVVYWAVAGGIPAVVVLVILFSHLFYAYCLPLLMSPVAYYRYIGASFIAVSVHALSYGSWMTPFYLVIVALMIIAAGHVERLRAQRRARRIATHSHA